MAATSTQQWHAVGRRKNAVARIYMRSGSGNIVVNNQGCDSYFGRDVLVMLLKQPLELTEHAQSFDIKINVRGGGKSGQAGAIRLGLARALQEYDPNLRSELKRAGYLTRDARKVERKKYGQPGARKRFQFSKR
ncbi:MAG: 30S ribosomal protein S9 [Myxococcales bacterium]|nr:30S ribosomal protein S9 [Myxococcales bacterium]